MSTVPGAESPLTGAPAAEQKRQASVLTAQTAPASPATRVAALQSDAASAPKSASDTALNAQASLPEKVAAYVAPPIPSSIKTSFAAWWRANHVVDAAHAELHLYRPTGYFEGASVDNVVCEDEELRDGRGLAKGLELARRAHANGHAQASSSNTARSHGHSHSVSSIFHTPKFWPFHRSKEPSTMTIGLTPAADGKVGCIRLVDLGNDISASASSKSLPGSANASLTSSPAVRPVADSGLPDLGDEATLNGNLGSASATQDGIKPYVPPSGRKINMLEIGIPYSKDKEEQIKNETKIVLAHGYGAGSGFFYQNIKAMAQVPDSRLYVLDWLGMGRSSRPTFHIPHAEAKNVDTRVAAAENFFISSLEEWRAKMGLEKMVLVGHSLGGYLSLAYALRYPSRVERLVLVSPVGIPNAPPEDEAGGTFRPKNRDAVEQEVNKPQEEVAPKSPVQELKDTSTANEMARKAAQNRSDGVIKGNSTGNGAASAPSLERSSTTQSVDSAKIPRSGQSAVPENPSHDPPKISKRMRSLFGFLWEQNVSPFGILRGSFFFGPMFAARYTSRRFGALPDDELRSLHAYCQSIFMSKGSGEYCLAHILAPGAYARKPMVDRIEKLKMPMSFLYGEHDWMDVRGGKEAVKRLRKQGNVKTNCFIVPNSGHHIYLDNPKPYDSLIQRILQGQADQSNK